MNNGLDDKTIAQLQEVQQLIKKLETTFKKPNLQLVFHRNGIDFVTKEGRRLVKSGTAKQLNQILSDIM